MILCIFCLNDTMDERYDRKGRPYIVCENCGCRAFIRNVGNLKAYAVVANEVALHKKVFADLFLSYGHVATGGVLDRAPAAKQPAAAPPVKAVGN